MGRLLRKKDSSQKKKKQQSDDKPSVESGSEAVTLKSSLSAASGSGKESQIKTASSRKMSIGTSGLKINNKYIDQAVQFLREVKVELKKVAWPTRKQTTGSTVVVIILVILLSVFLGLVDVGLSSLIKAVLS